MIHTPEDMTVTVAADATLADLQAALAQAGQWLPLDPPNPRLTLREMLDRNECGPRRYGYGTSRDYVIGLSVELADGRVVKSGGKVVKNVAGYDLQKLFIGSGGTLGVIREVTFKLRPVPEAEAFVQRPFSSDEQGFQSHFAKCGIIAETLEAVAVSAVTPVVFDLHHGMARDVRAAPTSAGEAVPLRSEGRAPVAMVLGFDGAKEDVDWQLALAAQLGFTQPATLEYDNAFRAGGTSHHTLSVLPSKLAECLGSLGDAPFVARAGNGIIFHRAGPGEIPRHSPPVTRPLERRVKDAFDPTHLLPDLPA